MIRPLLSTLLCPGGIFKDAQQTKASLRLTPRLCLSGTRRWVLFVTQTRPFEAPPLRPRPRPRLRTLLPTQHLIP